MMLSTPFLLLVIALCCSTAQTRNLLPSSRNNNNVNQTLVTSSGTAATVADAGAEPEAEAHLVVDGKTLQAVKQNLLDLEQASTVAVRQSSSVVQDWSLVCKQLCGAGLGGAACADVCLGVDKTLPRPHNATNMKRLLQANKPFICKDLCRLRLGNAACACAAAGGHELSVAERNEICRTFCEHGGLTLNGCGACKTATRSDIDANTNNDEDAKEVEDGIDGAIKVPNVTITTTTTTTTASKNSIKKEKEKQRETAHGSIMNSSSVGSNISVDVDVAVNIVGIKPAADVETTTPDWDEMCKILCKTGDGGSLCNCDLSPFFSL